MLPTYRQRTRTEYSYHRKSRGLGDLLQPWHEIFHVKDALVQQTHELVVNGFRAGGNPIAIDSQEDIDNGERRTLVPVDEWMVLNQAFQKCSSLVDDCVVVAGLRTMKG